MAPFEFLEELVDALRQRPLLLMALPSSHCHGLNWSWPVGGRGGVVPRQLVVTQDDQGAVRMQHRQFVDPTEIESPYQKIQEMKHHAQEQQNLITPIPNPPLQQLASSPPSTVNFIASSSANHHFY